MTDAAQKFVQHALQTRYDDISAQAIDAAKTFILDTIGVGMAGANAPLSDEVYRVASQWGDANAINGAHIWGRDTTLPIPSAAFVNGFQIHCQEYDCVHEAAVVHPLATILAALMAETENKKIISGQDFIAAVIIAVDVAASLGVAVTTPIRFFRPATAGLFGATLGIARLRNFSKLQAMNAVGLALAHCSGSMQAHVEGKATLPIQIGNAARAAHLACDLAELGIEGPHNVFEGPYGYFPLYEEEWELNSVLAQLGKIWRITEVSHKPFPTGRAAHGGIVAIQSLREQGVNAENLKTLELIAPPLIKRLVGRPVKDAMNVNYARLCFGYCGAVTLLEGDMGLVSFSPDSLNDKRVLQIGKCIYISENEITDPAAFTPQTAIATLNNGETRVATIESLLGSTARPLTKRQSHIKFNQCISYAGGNEMTGKSILSFVENLETVADASELARCTIVN